MRWREWFYAVPLRARSIFRRAQVEQELDEELQFHLEQRMQHEIAVGKTAAEARSVALREMGGIERCKEECRDKRRVSLVEHFVQDVRYAVRMLIKNPGFTATAVLVLAIGIGSNVAMFSVINSVVLRPLPYPSSDRLVALWKWRFPGGGLSASPADVVAWRDQARSFSAVAAYLKLTTNLSGQGDPEQVDTLRVTPNFFPVLGIEPARGRVFTHDEIQRGQERVVVVSNELWHKLEQSGDLQLGDSIHLNGEPHTIVGILPPSFAFGNDNAGLYLPLALDTSFPIGNSLSVVARLAPGVGRATAEAELTVISARLRDPGESSAMNPGVVPLKAEFVGDAHALLLPLFGAVSCVLLIGCATLANLLLARASVRRKEMAIRSALGASRGRLLAQMLTESVILALSGGSAGLAIAGYTLMLLVSARPKGLPRINEVNIDLTVVAFALGVSVITGILFGLAPALRNSRVGPNVGLKQDGCGFGRGSRHWVRNSLVVMEVAVSLVLLVGGGLLLNSFVRLVYVDPGFRADHVLTMRISLPDYSYPTGRRVATFFREVVDRVESVPGVQYAGVSNFLPLARGVSHTGFAVHDGPASTVQESDWNVGPIYYISPQYLNALSTPVVEGRGLTERDNRIDAAPIVLINRSFARRFFQDESPLGKRVVLKNQELTCTIVGVTNDMKNGGLGDDQLWLSKPAWATLYLPHALRPSEMYGPPWTGGRSMYLVVRTAGDPLALAEAVRRGVWEVDPNQPIADIKTMNKRVMDSVASRRLGLWPVLAFAAIALALALGGIYGLVAYAVAQRTREVGIRMALGATRTHVLRLMMRDTMRWALVGVVIGIIGGQWLTRVLATQLYAISATDPATYVFVVLLLLSSVLLASYIPARRATSADPVIALRYE